MLEMSFMRTVLGHVKNLERELIAAGCDVRVEHLEGAPDQTLEAMLEAATCAENSLELLRDQLVSELANLKGWRELLRQLCA